MEYSASIVETIQHVILTCDQAFFFFSANGEKEEKDCLIAG